MLTMTRLRGAIAVASVAAAGALALPGAAYAGKSHHLKLYKQEMHVDVEGDTYYDLACPDGDIATDGMWRVDDVSQDNEFDNLAQWTQTVAVQASGVDESTYRFRFLPIAGGDVQVKLWVTCLQNPVTGNGHTHTFTTVAVTQQQAAVTATGQQSYSLLPAANACKKGEYVPIQPGFDMTNADDPTPDPYDGYGYVMKSWDDSNATDVGWQWKFNVTSAGTTGADRFRVTTSFRCLKRKSGTGGTPLHSHRIVVQNKSLASQPVLHRSFETHEVRCGEHYKGMVGMWDVSHDDLYFLGMDPRIKIRAFKFVNPSANDRTANLKLTCFKDRTT